MNYWKADEVENIADDILAHHHPDLGDIEIRYVFRDKATQSGGKTVLGKARKVTGLNALLAGAHDPELGFFVIEIAHREWRLLTKSQRIALVDHELCHCTLEEDDDGYKLALRSHDIEEFAEIIERRGLWHDDLKTVAQSVQLALFGEQQTIDGALDIESVEKEGDTTVVTFA